MSIARSKAIAFGSTLAIGVGLVVSSAAAAAAAPSASGGSATSTWVATATKGMKVVHATMLGATPASTPVSVALGLRVRDAAGLKTLAQEVNTPGSKQGHWLTPAGFLATYAPTVSQVRAVTTYLSKEGFTRISVASNRLYVSADGTAGQADKAFNTQLVNYPLNGKTVYVNHTAADVPASLGGTVLSVLGLEDIVSFQYKPIVNTKHVGSAVRAGAKAATPPSTGPCALPNGPGTGNLPGTYPDCYGYSPKEFQTAYDATSVATGSKTAIAIMTEGDLTQVLKDLRQEETAFSLPQVPVSVVPVGVPSTDTSGADEWDLDTQYSTGMADQVKHLYIYDVTSLTDSDIGLEFNKWASQDLAQGGSASFGECEEFPYLDGMLVTNDEAMNEAAAQGQTMHASAGDTGASCAVAPTNGVPESGPPQVNYPCSSPYIVCVGGTTLYTNPDFSYQYASQYNPAFPAGDAGETAWQASGGGTSANEYAPYWQSCVTPNYTANQRDAPDISMDADENDGAVVDVDGTFEEIGGTSVSSPLALGVWARLESAHDNKLGFAAPRLYALYPAQTCVDGAGTPPATPLTTPSYPFHDVFQEGNATYNATPGYDLITGLGSYDVGLVNKAICSAKDPCAPPPPPGHVEVCQSSAHGVTGSWQFTFDGTKVTVPTGACTSATEVPSGTLRVCQVHRSGYSFVSASTSPKSRLVSVSKSSACGSVKIVAGGVSSETIVTFVDQTTPPPTGTLKICQVAGSGVASKTDFTFTNSATSQTTTVPAGPAPGGYCVVVGKDFKYGDVTVTQKIPSGDKVSGISVDPSSRKTGSSPAKGTASITIGSGVTEVTYTDQT